jgi:hypothetical protein
MSVLKEARDIFTLARREVRQRWPLLAVAVALGLIPAVASAFWPGVRPQARVVGTVEYFAALALAAFLGLSLIGDDLAAGRLGWYFARPLSGFAIWAGKVGGGAALALAMAFAMTTPALLLVLEEPWTRYQSLFNGMALDLPGFVAGPLLFLGAGAVGGIIARSRSRWLLLDAATVLGLALVLPWMADRFEALEKAGRGRDVPDVEPAILVVSISALLLASAAGVMVGRADARRAHAAASLAMSAILAPAQLALFCYVRWFVA